MKQLSLVTLAFFATAGSALAQKQTYSIDPAHSEVGFSIRHMAISTVHGRFALKGGTVILNSKNVSDSAVEALIDVQSVDTGTAQRDDHLKSPEFFDVAKNPTATFKSMHISRSGDGFDVLGNLTLHGVTKPVTLHMDEPSKEQTGIDNKMHRGFSATTTLHRQDFGLVWNGVVKSGDNVIGDDVKMTFDIEAVAN
jgi:polyisoprenoid-binding protein YceI